MSDHASLESARATETFGASRFKLIFPALILAVVGAAIYLGGSGDTGPANAPLVGRDHQDGFAWQTDYRVALQMSRDSGKPVLIDFAATWCGPCKIMERQVWSDSEVQQRLAKKVVPLKIDIDSTQGSALAERYGIQYVPTMLLVDGNGKEGFRFGFASAEDVSALLDRIR